MLPLRLIFAMAPPYIYVTYEDDLVQNFSLQQANNYYQKIIKEAQEKSLLFPNMKSADYYVMLGTKKEDLELVKGVDILLFSKTVNVLVQRRVSYMRALPRVTKTEISAYGESWEEARRLHAEKVDKDFEELLLIVKEMVQLYTVRLANLHHIAAVKKSVLMTLEETIFRRLLTRDSMLKDTQKINRRNLLNSLIQEDYAQLKVIRKMLMPAI